MARVRFWDSLSKTAQKIAATISAIIVIGGAIIAGLSWAVECVTSRVNERLDKIETQLNEVIVDSTRTQLLMLMTEYPDDKHRILTVAKKYFSDLSGDWYVSGLFARWATQHDVDISGIKHVHAEREGEY